jgi:tight adherence protein B
MAFIFFTIIGALIAYLLFDYFTNYQRNQQFERITIGFEPTQLEQEEAGTNLAIININRIKALTEQSPILTKLSLNLQRAGIVINVLLAFLLIVIISSIIATAAYMWSDKWWTLPLAWISTYLLQWNTIKFFSTQKQKKHDNQLSTLISTFLTTMRSGGTPMQALTTTAINGPQPIAGSIQNILDNLQLGRNPNAVWKEWADYWDTKHARLLATGIRLKWETGGEMTKMIEHIQDTFEFSKRIELRVESVTALTKLSAIVLSFITPGMFLLLYFKRPDLMDNMFADETGVKLLYTSAGLVILGFFWMRKLGKLKG